MADSRITILILTTRRGKEDACLYEVYLRDEDFDIIKVTSFEKALEIMLKQKVSLMIVFASQNIFADKIDYHSGTQALPPIIYWYRHDKDVLPRPRHTGLTPVWSGIRPRELISVVKLKVHNN